MNDRKRNSMGRWLGAMVAASMLLAACGTSAEPPIPTREPAPTFTPTTEGAAPAVDPAVEAAAATAAAQAAAPQEEPAAEQPATEQPAAQEPAATQPAAEEAAPAETPTTAPTPTVVQAAEVVINSQINVRGGPGTNYNIVGAANAGQRYPVTGKNNDGTWWQINFNGQAGWVFGELVTAQNVQAVAVAPNIPAPPPTNTPAPVPPTPVPQPTQPPADQPPAEQPPAEQPPAEQPPANNDSFPFTLGATESCAPNAGNTYFSGFIRDSNNNLMNGVCVHIAFYGPRTTKCSGCDGVGDGIWGFNPFGGPADPGTTVEIFVVPCSGNMPFGGQTEQSGFGDLTPQSPKWTRTINASEQCTGITFYKK
ncbi:MAG: SH3 domain-containing protein [Caldilineaceae bacterium]|nr:SH3 domain-containing protein [Caldilineaceae bacterium]